VGPKMLCDSNNTGDHVDIYSLCLYRYTPMLTKGGTCVLGAESRGTHYGRIGQDVSLPCVGMGQDFERGH
jgi:hypothetical protein